MATPSLFDLNGHVAVVTGGNRGIGFGMARGLARAGADVAIWSRSVEQNEIATEELGKLGVRALPVSCDIGSEESIEAACATTVKALGRIDSCFANAGFGDYYNPLKASLERWRRVLDINLDGSFLTLREVAKHMVERGGGGVFANGGAGGGGGSAVGHKNQIAPERIKIPPIRKIHVNRNDPADA